MCLNYENNDDVVVVVIFSLALINFQFRTLANFKIKSIWYTHVYGEKPALDLLKSEMRNSFYR